MTIEELIEQLQALAAKHPGAEALVKLDQYVGSAVEPIFETREYNAGTVIVVGKTRVPLEDEETPPASA